MSNPGARLKLLPHAEFQRLAPSLRERARTVRTLITPEVFPSLLSNTARELLHLTLSEIGADEGTVWVVDPSRENLVPAYNTGSDAEKFVLSFKQPIGSGLIGMVVATEAPFAENQVQKNEMRNPALDSRLGLKTAAMLAVPFYFLNECTGVISCVQLDRGVEERSGFSANDLNRLQLTSDVMTQMLDLQLVGRLVGWLGE